MTITIIALVGAILAVIVVQIVRTQREIYAPLKEFENLNESQLIQILSQETAINWGTIEPLKSDQITNYMDRTGRCYDFRKQLRIIEPDNPELRDYLIAAILIVRRDTRGQKHATNQTTK